MSILIALHTIIIYPIYQLIEFAYKVFLTVFGNTGIAILGVSTTVTLLCLPLYAVAESWQESDRLMQLSMQDDIAHIKRTYKGDERYMLMQTLYRQRRYSPIMQLRQSFGVLIQIPFFLAAYQYLSHNADLVGQSLSFIRDLGKPDGLVHVGNFSLNILPIAMTLINLASGMVYSKGHGVREKIQITAMALVFLVILYKSPAGLVLYWLLNNFFSMVKNLFYKMRHPLKTFHAICCVVMILVTVYLLFKRFERVKVFIFASVVLPLLPRIGNVLSKIFCGVLSQLDLHKKTRTFMFLFSSLALAILVGTGIPSLLMTSSPSEYSYIDTYTSPLYFLLNSTLQSIGCFFFWPTCVYLLFAARTSHTNNVSANKIAYSNNGGKIGVFLPAALSLENISLADIRSKNSAPHNNSSSSTNYQDKNNAFKSGTSSGKQDKSKKDNLSKMRKQSSDFVSSATDTQKEHIATSGFCTRFSVQAVFAFVAFVSMLCGLADNFAFQGDYGAVNAHVNFIEHRTYIPSIPFFLENCAAILAIIGVVSFLLAKGHKKTVSAIYSIALLCVISLSLVNVIQIESAFQQIPPPTKNGILKKERFIKLSRTNKNVIVIMMDASLGAMIPYAFSYDTSLKEKFSGFTFYPNCASLGPRTIQGAVCLFGGYEYSPWGMNQRKDVAMVDKHNEGLSLLSNIFSHNGWNCTVMDVPYPNYDEPPFFKAFSAFPNTTCHQLIGKYTQTWCNENNIVPIPVNSRLIKRNLLWFGIFKTVPVIVRPFVAYDKFWRARGIAGEQDITSFLDNYSLLDYLPDFTDVGGDKPGFLMMDNEICHESAVLQLPNFTITNNIDNSAFKKSSFENSSLFHTTIASYRKLGEYFDFLRENGLWENTRIVIAADHGTSDRFKTEFEEAPSYSRYPFEALNPVLLVKDFGSNEPFHDDKTYMTHGDVPAIALHGIIDNPHNPYTGESLQLLTTHEKEAKSIISFSRKNGIRSTVGNCLDIKDEDWWTVKGDIFHTKNWRRLIDINN